MHHPYLYAGLRQKTKDRSSQRYHTRVDIDMFLRDKEFEAYCYDFFDVRENEIKSRMAHAVAARSMIDLHYMHKGMTLSQIARHIHNCHHSTIINRLQQIYCRMREPAVKEFFKRHSTLNDKLISYIHNE